jgi:hypothetical protein
MAKQIAKLLKASIQETSDLKEIARMLSKKGRGGDTMLAHITPKEAALLKESGGSGTVNPDTGLLEFYDGYDDFSLMKYAGEPDYQTGGYRTREPINIEEQSARFAPVDIAEQSFANQPVENFTRAPAEFFGDYGDMNRAAGFVPLQLHQQLRLLFMVMNQRGLRNMVLAHRQFLNTVNPLLRQQELLQRLQV